MRDHRARTAATRSSILVVVLLAACSNGSDADADSGATTTTSAADAAAEATSSTTSSTTSTTEPAEVTTTSSAPTTGSTGRPAESRELVEETFTTDDGTIATYRLTLRNGDLCFEADLDNPDPAIDASFGTGIDDCLDGLDEPGEPLIASTGSLDGEQRFGYVWGRAAVAVERLVVRFATGGEIELTPAAVGETPVFALVIDTEGRGEAETLDALDGDGAIVSSLPIRAFLRSGPTYPSVAPTTAPSPTYPSTGGAGGPTGGIDG